MQHRTADRRDVRGRALVTMAAVALLVGSVLASSTVAPAAGATVSPEGPYDDERALPEEPPEEPPEDSPGERPNGTVHANGSASVSVHLNSDEGMTAEVECEGNVTATLTVEVLDGSYAGADRYVVTCNESLSLPAPEQAVTLRLTVEIGEETFERTVTFDPEPEPPEAYEQRFEEASEQCRQAIEEATEGNRTSVGEDTEAGRQAFEERMEKRKQRMEERKRRMEQAMAECEQRVEETFEAVEHEDGEFEDDHAERQAIRERTASRNPAVDAF